jgi:hypothetical protein
LIIYIGHVYEFLRVLKNFKFSLKIHRWLAYNFTTNHQFAVKTDRNFVFHGRHSHILDRLYIMISYMSFCGFKKIWNFSSKSIGVRLRFYRKSPVCAKNVWNSVFHARVLHVPDWLYIMVPYLSFCRFWKNWNFHSKYIGDSLRIYRESLVYSKSWLKLRILWSWPLYSKAVIHNDLIYGCLQVLK